MTNKLEFKLNKDNLRADKDDKSTSVKKSFKMSENASSLDYKAMYADIINTFGYINNPIDSDAVYITKSGKFLDTKGPYNDHQHINIADYLTDKYHYKDADANNGSRFMSQIAHAIRVTCWDKGAGLKGIYLPKQEITQLQYDAIAKFANAVSKKVNKDNPLIVATENGSQQIEYTKSFKLAERVVNDIKYYYQTGKLEIVESLTEAKAITWGDLDYAKKTDTRKMMSGRGTGHFGTGFYFVGEDGPYGINGEKFYDYEPSRPIYEIDLDKYNLFKPRDNESAYKLHDALRQINNYYSSDLRDFLFKNIFYDTDKLKDELYGIYSKANSVNEDLEDEDDLDFDDSDFDYSNDNEDDDKKDEEFIKEYTKLIKQFLDKYQLTDWLYTDNVSVDEWIAKNSSSLGRVEKEIKDAIEQKEKSIYYVESGIRYLSSLFDVSENTIIALLKAFSNMKSEDSLSTLLLKELGYEGVDVTHLNHDAQGLSGLDNFSYGTVIYDLKPGTYRRIIEPREKTNESLLNEDKVLRLPKDVTFQFINRLKDTYKGISLQELPIDKLVKDNDLLNDDDLESYHQGEWEHAKAKDFHIDKNKLSGLRLGNTPFVVQKKDGTLKLSDGRHRTRAAYNDGYTHVEYPTYVEEQLKEYLDEIEDRGDSFAGIHLTFCPIYHTDEVYTIKRMLEKGDEPYRILRLEDNSYLIQNALGNKTHGEMFYKAVDDGYVEMSDDWSSEDDTFMVFIPKDFNGKLLYNTRLGADYYFDCRVYDFGVVFVRDKKAFKNSLFNALGTFEREISYDKDNLKVVIDSKDNSKELTLKDLDNNPNNAININLNKPQLVRAESLKEDVNKYYRLELEDCWRNRLGLFTGAFESIPSKETIENYPEDFEDLTQEERERYYRFDELLNELSKIKSPGVDATFQNFKEDDIFAFTSSKYNEILPIIKEMRQLLKEMGFKLIIKELDIDDLNISYRDNDQVAFSKSNSSKYVNEKIVKKGSKWQVQSEKGKNLGTVDTKKEAEKRLKQVHYFKHVNESKQDIEKFRQWAGDELADRFFAVKNRLEGKYRDIYYYIGLEKDTFERLIKFDRWKDNQEKAREYAHKVATEALENAIEILEDTPTRKQIDKQAKEGAEKIYEDGRWLVVKINTYGAAVKYGKNTQWCITGTNSQTDGGIYDWKYHHESCECDFYFYIDKKNNHKYALEYYDDYNWALYTEEDYVEVGRGWPFNAAMDALGEPWSPYEHTSYPAFPKVDGLPDLQQAYRDAIRIEDDSDLDVSDFKVESLNKSLEEKVLYKFHRQVKENEVLLYHQTSEENLKEILSSGYIKADVWSQEHIDSWRYGDYAIAFAIDKDKVHKANDTDRIIYRDVPKEDFVSILGMTSRTKTGKENFRKEFNLDEDLTKEQEDYFKNSKIRDEKGNLLICYHGTENPGFKEFDARKGKSQFGDYKFSNYNVNYFTTNKETAVGYTDLGYEHDDNVYACYLNVVNPYIVNNRTEDDMYKTWQNIKDDKVREKEISYFNRFYNKWKNREKDLDELNKDLFYLNFKFVPNEENENYYDLYELSNNNLYGAGHPVMYAYSLEEFFDDDQFVEFRDVIVGDYEGEDKDYFHYTVDNLIRWVLLMNEEDGTNYDGIIVSDIYDIGPRGSAFTTGKTTDIITLKSSNQIKRIDNLKPTSNSNIDEANIIRNYFSVH